MDHRIKRVTFSIVTLIAVVCADTGHRIAAFQETQTGEIVLAEGTALNVVTTQEITSKTASPNDPVSFKVDEDLVVNGQVIIRKGTAAIGSVMHAQKGGYLGKSGKLGIQVESTQTVDEKQLKLRAAKGKKATTRQTPRPRSP